jgi:ATP-binding cassette, subfamily C, bacterial CydD
VAFLSALVLELAAAVSTALVAVEVGLRLLAGHLGYQTALVVLLLTPEAYLPLRAVGLHFHASMEGAAAAGRVCDIIETAPSPACVIAPGTGEAATADLRYDDITLDGVSLAYPGRDRPALAEVSLTIRPGDQIAVIGPNGAGKSSLHSLLLRFTEPTGGRITAGGVDLTRIDLDNWRRQVAWVPQRPFLFAATAADNIALGQPDASREDITRAARLAGADAFIEALPHGYDTPLGEQALRLSAGERQRIALARAFLRDAPLLLLDEPTAHLDPIVAGQILAVIQTLMAGRTVILVTHRHGWPGGADRVLTLDHGRLLIPALDEPAGHPAAVVP